MRRRTTTVVWLSGPAIAGGAAAAAWWPGLAFPEVVAAFVAAHLLTIPNATGRGVSFAPAVASAAALGSGGSLVLVLGGAAVAAPLSWLVVRVLHGSRVTALMMPTEQAGIAGMALSFAAATTFLPSAEPGDLLVLVAFAVAASLGFLVAVASHVIVSERRRVVSARLVALTGLAEWPVWAALFSSAALFAVTLRPMQWWSIAVAGLPYLFSYVSLHRLQDTRRTYDQTIRALGAIPEAGGQVDGGHSSRTAELAVAIGGELGLRVRALQRLEHAALLHDIGRVVLSNPAVAATEHSFADVAQWSAAIIAEARLLEPVATIVASQHAPYRMEGQVRDDTVPRTSQVIRVAARYDSARASGASVLEALEALHRGAAYDYDPEIVTALRRVLRRRGALAA